MQLTIPKGSILSIPVNVIQNDSEIWGADAHIFRPKRWLERKESSRLNGHEIFAFSEGCVLYSYWYTMAQF
jgi:cytochrome P450